MEKDILLAVAQTNQALANYLLAPGTDANLGPELYEARLEIDALRDSEKKLKAKTREYEKQIKEMESELGRSAPVDAGMLAELGRLVGLASSSWSTDPTAAATALRAAGKLAEDLKTEAARTVGARRKRGA